MRLLIRHLTLVLALALGLVFGPALADLDSHPRAAEDRDGLVGWNDHGLDAAQQARAREYCGDSRCSIQEGWLNGLPIIIIILPDGTMLVFEIPS